MKIEDFELLIDNCQITAEEDKVYFTPYSNKDNQRVAKILVDEKMNDLSVDGFNQIVEQKWPTYQARKKVKQQKLDKYNKMTTEEISKLPKEDKVEYIELLFPQKMTKAQVIDVCEQNEANIRACLFNLDFPQSFWQKEKKQADRYVALIANSPELVEKLKNWPNTSLDDKKNVIKQSLKIFEYVYGSAPKLEFYTEAQERERLVKLGFPKDTHINAAYFKDGKIYFNEERLQKSENFFAISVPFHEGTHYRQDRESFGNPLIDRLFNSNANYATIYENQRNNKEDKNYKDFYTMMPGEIHAYGLQEYMENALMEKTGLERTKNNDTKIVKNVHNKGYSMSKVNQYRSR